MKVQKSHRTPLASQVGEGVEINSCKSKIVMNSKGEWNGSRLPRMVIEQGEEIELDEDDINIRMTNWEKDDRRNKKWDRTEAQKRKNEVKVTIPSFRNRVLKIRLVFHLW